MRSVKTILTLLALLTSFSVLADRSRDRGHQPHKPLTQTHRQHKQVYHSGRDHQRHSSKKHNKRYDQHHNQKNHRYHNNHRDHYPRHGQGFSGDYRSNPHFDRRHYQGSPRGGYGHDHGHGYHPPKKYYKKWKKRMKKYHKKWRKHHRYYHNYRPYTDDWYRYQPLRGLGHYFHRPGYGYGHWHEGMWCPDYHSEAWYRNYYSYYPYHDGWRFGDGDFGIWFRF